MRGKVTIVGAGPGAADLLTLRAASVLRAAQVVLHDDLVAGEILDLAPASAEIINVGKRCGRHGSSQEQINQLMIFHARQGAAVIRLKAGDPAVLGRLGEELDALRAAHVEYEIVPGVTAAMAAASSAAITLTDRRFASRLMVLTAHNCHGQSLADDLFNPEQTTYAIYMPGPDYARTARELQQAGLAADTPCALISNASRHDERVELLTLKELRSVTTVRPPAVLIVGEVVRADKPEELREEISAFISTHAIEPTTAIDSLTE